MEMIWDSKGRIVNRMERNSWGGGGAELVNGCSTIQDREREREREREIEREKEIA